LTERRREEVMQVLDQIGAGPEHNQDIIEVWNKVDLLGDVQMDSITERSEASDEIISVEIPPQNYDVRAWLHKNGHVINEKTRRNGNCEMDVRLSESDAGKLRARHSALVT